jgi:hypothetical protein
MLLSELEWVELWPGSGIKSAVFNRHAHGMSPLDDGIIYRFMGDKYTIIDRRVTPRREWGPLDELTAECILIELTKSPHRAEDHPLQPSPEARTYEDHPER